MSIVGAYCRHGCIGGKVSTADVASLPAPFVIFLVLLQLVKSVEPIRTFSAAEQPDSDWLCVNGFLHIVGRYGGCDVLVVGDTRVLATEMQKHIFLRCVFWYFLVFGGQLLSTFNDSTHVLTI